MKTLASSRQQCAVMNGPHGVVSVMSVESGGVLFWELSSNRCVVHLPNENYPRLDLDELRDVPGVDWTLEQKFIQHCIEAIAPTVH